MSKSTRKRQKMMNDVRRSQEIRRQKEMQERPFRQLIYRGKKAVTAVQKGGGQ